METVDVQHATTYFSTLLEAVEGGAEVTITRGDKAVARLVPVEQARERELGFVAYEVPESFFDPLAESELAAWEGS